MKIDINCWGPFHLIDTPPLPMKKVTIYTQRKKRSKANWCLTPSEKSQYKVLKLFQKKKKQFISQHFRIYDKDKRCPIATLPPPKTYFLSFTASENPINNWWRGTGCLNIIPLRADKGGGVHRVPSSTWRKLSLFLDFNTWIKHLLTAIIDCLPLILTFWSVHSQQYSHSCD